MPDKYAKMIDALGQSWPGLLLMADVVRDTPLIRQIAMAMLIVAIPTAGGAVVTINVLEREIHHTNRAIEAVRIELNDEIQQNENLRDRVYHLQTQVEVLKASWKAGDVQWKPTRTPTP